MSATSEDVYRALQSIDATLKLMAEHSGALRAEPSRASSGAGGAPAIASDADLDSKHGNPEVRTKDPRDWTGDSMRGKRFSECPPVYLDLYAPFLDWMSESSRSQSEDSATTSDDKAKATSTARYKHLDANRARGWAARLRAGWKAPATTGFASDVSDPVDVDSIPF